MPRRWIRSVEMIHTAHQITQNGFIVPIHWRQQPIPVRRTIDTIFTSTKSAIMQNQGETFEKIDFN